MADNTKTRIVFPEYLSNEPHRKITITAVKSKGYASSISDAINKALDMTKSIGDAATSAPSDLTGTLNNLAANYQNSDETAFTFVLPLPNELTDTQQHDWNTAKGITGTVLGGMENQSISQALGGKIGESIASTGAESLPVIGAGIAAGLGMEVQQALGAMSDAAGMRKPLADPGYFQNYTGSQPRTFNMTFDLVPANPREARDVIEIILKLKEFSAPELTSGVSMLAPHYFDIDISNKFISGLANMNGVVLQNMVVNYSADGSMQQYADGTPKYIQLGLTFVERRMQHRELYQKQIYR